MRIGIFTEHKLSATAVGRVFSCPMVDTTITSGAWPQWPSYAFDLYASTYIISLYNMHLDFGDFEGLTLGIIPCIFCKCSVAAGACLIILNNHKSHFNVTLIVHVSPLPPIYVQRW